MASVTGINASRPAAGSRLSPSTVLGLGLLSCAWLILAFRLLDRSLWIDEAVTYWIAAAPWSEVAARTLAYQGQSPLYFLLEHGLLETLGKSEIALRISSYCCFLLTCLVICRLAARLCGSSAAAIAVLFFCASANAIALGVSARPYAVGVLMVTLSVAALLDWIGTGKKKSYVVFIVAAILAVYSHYLFAVSMLLHAVAFICFTRGKFSAARMWLFVLAEGIVAAVIAPGLWQLGALPARASLTFPDPGLLQAVLSVLDAPMLVMLTAAACWQRVWRWPWPRWKELLGQPALQVLACWWLLPPAALWAAGWASGHPVFQSRYIAWYLPGWAILMALLVASAFPRRLMLAMVLIVQTLQAFTAYYRPALISEGWAAVSAELRERAGEGLLSPVLAHTAMMESENPDWIAGEQRKEYLLSPFSFYPVPQKVEVLPWFIHRESDLGYLRQNVFPLLCGADRILAVTRGGSEGVDYLSWALEAHAMKVENTRCFGEVCLLTLKRAQEGAECGRAP